ncbi:MAG: hypothetical protein ACK5GN_01475 [Pseudomonadota bacterium]
MPVLLARTFARHYSVLQKSLAKSRVLENAIDSRMRIKTTTYSDVQQKPCQLYWHGLLHVTIGLALHCGKKDRLGGDFDAITEKTK